MSESGEGGAVVVEGTSGTDASERASAWGLLPLGALALGSGSSLAVALSGTAAAEAPAYVGLLGLGVLLSALLLGLYAEDALRGGSGLLRTLAAFVIPAVALTALASGLTLALLRVLA